MDKSSANKRASRIETVYFLVGLILAYIFQKLINGEYIPRQMDIAHIIPTIVVLSTAIILLVKKITKREINRFGLIFLLFVFSFGWSLGVSFSFKF